MQDFRWCGIVVCMLVERRLLAQQAQSDVGTSWIALGENIPLPRVHLEDSIEPLERQKTLRAPENGFD